jgi:hypothetical protein
MSRAVDHLRKRSKMVNGYEGPRSAERRAGKGAAHALSKQSESTVHLLTIAVFNFKGPEITALWVTA